MAQRFPDRFQIVGLSAGKNIALLKEQIKNFKPRVVAVQDENLACSLRALMPPGTQLDVVYGTEGYKAVATLPEVDVVVSAMVGAAGLVPTHEAILSGKNIALANKEVLVMAGSLIMKTAAEAGISIIPVDSEHSAIFQCLLGNRKEDLYRIILTASGGPFLNFSHDSLREVTPDQALRHPNWNMGKKITIDSASLMNKGLEIIEAKWLFGVSTEQISVVIHPQSVIHSMVEFNDGSVIGQLGIPDMRLPISYALSFPDRIETGLRRLNLPEIGQLTFMKPDLDRFPCLRIAFAACEKGGALPIALNAANEVAVAAFLDGRLRFTDIAPVVENTMSSFKPFVVDSLPDIMKIDRLARIKAQDEVNCLVITHPAERKIQP